MIWRPCPMCWGQGRILEPCEYGFLVHVCETCLGVATIPVPEAEPPEAPAS